MKAGAARLGAGALLVLACDRPIPITGATTVPAAAASQGAVEPSFLEASARGATEDEAYAQARLALAEALLGDASWLDVVPLRVHDRDTDRVSLEIGPEGMTRATVALSRVRAASVLSAFTETELRVEGPPVWRETLYTFFLAHVAGAACERRRVLFESDCEAADTSEVDAALAEVASGLVLAPSYLGGVPLDPERRPLRPPGTYALWRGLPIGDLPLMASRPGDAEPVLGRSDARGHASFPVAEGQPWSGALTIAVDTRALLGPLHTSFPESGVSIDGRPADLRRWSAVVVERGQTVATPAGPVLDGMAEALRRRGMDEPVELPEKHVRAIARDRGGDPSNRMRTAADDLGGRLDVVLVVEVDSRFASRMGAGRVWYEARGSLEAYEAWSGRALASLQTSAKASGLGNERADAAARRALGEALAILVLGSSEIPKPPAGASVAARRVGALRSGRQPASVE